MSEKVTMEKRQDVVAALGQRVSALDAKEVAGPGATPAMYTADDTEFVIAYSADDAAKVYAEWARYPPDFREGYVASLWKRMDDDKTFALVNVSTGIEVTKFCWEWVAERGRGHFASKW